MKTYSDYLASIFPDYKVQKISINAGFSCPNRDGTIGTGGCIYCRNDSFTPSYCFDTKDIKQQIEAGKIFFRRKYPGMKFIAYFQSYSNTYSSDIIQLESLYKSALECEDIVGLAIGTRPDILPDNILDLLGGITRHIPVFLEIGAETSFDSTLSLINRNHTWKDVVDAVCRANERGLHCGLHLIAGLPGETAQMIYQTVEKACGLPIETLKFHQLQILYGTPLHQLYCNSAIDCIPLSSEKYIEICAEILKIVPENIIIERFVAQSPPELVFAPKWNLKNYQFMQKLRNHLSSQEV